MLKQWKLLATSLITIPLLLHLTSRKSKSGKYKESSTKLLRLAQINGIKSNKLNIRQDNTLCNLVDQLDNELVRVYDALAPPKQVSSLLRTKQPWYDSEMKELKKSVTCHECKWLKYKLDSCWKAYKSERNKYFGKLNYKKKTSIQQKIQNCHKDTKKLHKLVTHLMGTEPQNPLPNDANNDEDLANSFADFFHSKIEKIYEMFDGTETGNS